MGRQLQVMGYEVRLIAPAYVKPFVKRQKNDAAEKVPLPKAERDLIGRHLDELDWMNKKLETLDRDLIRIALDDPSARKLMTVAGISYRDGGSGLDRRYLPLQDATATRELLWLDPECSATIWLRTPHCLA